MNTSVPFPGNRKTMKPEIKQKWIDALRSGEYDQDAHELKTPHGYCCLGVLTDIYIKEQNLEWKRFDGDTEKEFTSYEFNGFEGSLCPEVIDWSSFPDGKTEAILIEMNDDQRKTFDEIADYVEANL